MVFCGLAFSCVMWERQRPNRTAKSQTVHTVRSAEVLANVRGRLTKPTAIETKGENMDRKSLKKKVQNANLNFRVTTEEKAAIESFAKSSNLSVSDYLRLRTLSGKVQQPKVQAEIAQTIVQNLSEISVELSRQGNNLNQIAKYTNSSRSSYKSHDAFLGEPVPNIPVDQLNALQAKYERLREEIGKVWQLLA